MCSKILVLLSLLVAFVHSAKLDYSTFHNGVRQGQVVSTALDRIAGLVSSRVHGNIVYAHGDEYGTNNLYAVNVTTGQVVATYTMQGANNYDWEDAAYGPCADDCAATTCSAGVTPARYCIYIGDIGDHGTDGAANVIYMVREPATLQDGILDVVDTLTFSWPEEDCETLMIAPDSRLFVVSKIDTGRAMIAQLPVNGWGRTTVLDLTNTGILKIFTDHHDPQGGDISPDGTEMVFVCEEDLVYYRVPGQDYINAVRTIYPASIANYTVVPSTEAVAWSADGQGFYTIAQDVQEYIYYYQKA